MKFILLLLSTSMIIQLSGQNMNQENWRSFEDVEYSIQYSKKWDLNTSGANNTSFILVSNQEGSAKGFKENINLLINVMPNESINLDYFTKASEMQVTKAFENSNLIESVRVRSENGEYQSMTYTGEKQGVKLKFMQRYWVKMGKAYILTFSCNEEEFTPYYEEVKAIFNTFEFKLK